MGRILLVLTAALVMAAMLVVMAAPAFADHSAGHTDAQRLTHILGVCLALPEPGITECLTVPPENIQV